MIDPINNNDVIINDNFEFDIERFENPDQSVGLAKIKDKIKEKYKDDDQLLTKAMALVFSAESQTYFELGIHRMLYGSLAQIAMKTIVDPKFLYNQLCQLVDLVGIEVFDKLVATGTDKDGVFFDFGYTKMMMLACAHVGDYNLMDIFRYHDVRPLACQYAQQLKDTAERHDRSSILPKSTLCDWCPMAFDHLTDGPMMGTCFNGHHQQLRLNLAKACNHAFAKDSSESDVLAHIYKVVTSAQCIYRCPVRIGVRTYHEKGESD